jgi:predicted DNA-binding WGR domain protein
MIHAEQIYLECVIPEKNRNAYYRMMSGQDLFGFKLIRCWGRIGTQEKIRLQKRFARHDEMKRAYQRILSVRLAHGYTIKEKVPEFAHSGVP